MNLFLVIVVAAAVSLTVSVLVGKSISYGRHRDEGKS